MPEAPSGTEDTVDIATWYEIDAAGRVTAVCPEWDAVARQAGGAAGALQAGVIGRPLHQFISGDPTRMYMDAALQAVRLMGQPRRLRYRCDTPTVRRTLEMTLVPLDGGGVRISHGLIEQQPRLRPLVCLPDERLAGEGAGVLWCCSLCLRLQQAGQPWRAPDLVASPRLVVRYTVCPRCWAG
jgi:hypothetical protein